MNCKTFFFNIPNDPALSCWLNILVAVGCMVVIVVFFALLIKVMLDAEKSLKNKENK